MMETQKRIELIEAKDVLRRMRQDFTLEPEIALWCYTVQPQFFRQYFIDNRPGKATAVILDYKQRTRLTHLLKERPELQIRHWQRNRTQHDKTILCVTQKIVWLTTSNLHRGSFMLANNRAIRCTDSNLFLNCFKQFTEQWKISIPAEETDQR